MPKTIVHSFNRLVTESQILIAAWSRPVRRKVLAFRLARAFCLASVLSLLTIGSARAASVVWNYSSGDRNWSTSGNWTGGTPDAANDILFNNTDAQTTNTPVNTVDASVTVRSLTYTNFYTAAYLSFQNTAIASGQTLTVTNGLTVGVDGALNFPVGGPYTYVTITGPAATLNVSGGNVKVGYQSSSSATGVQIVHDVLDLRTLGSFSYINPAGTFGVAAQAQARQGGEVFLADTNNITASALSIGIGRNATIGSNPALLHLGKTNNLFADTMTIGTLFTTSVVDFQTGLTNPFVKIRGADGVSSVGAMYLGWNTGSGTGTQQAGGTNDFSGGIVDAMITNLYVGWSSATVNRFANGAFILGTNSQNVLSVGNLYIGSVTNLAAIATTTSAGSFEMRGGTVTAGTVTVAQLAALGSSKGQLKLTGGTMSVTGNIAVGLGSSTGIVANATLNVNGLIGASGQYLTALTLTNGTLGLNLLGGSNPSAFVTNLMVDAPSTISFTCATPTLGQFPLIAYDTVGGLAGVAGITLAPPTGVTATLSNNVANKTLDVVITGAPNKLAITTTAQTLIAGVTSGTITVQLQNLSGTPQNAVSSITVNLSSTSAAGLFRNLADTATITSVTIPSGQNSASFKYKDTIAPATPTLTASTTIGITAGTQVETLNAAAASQLGFTTQPVNGYLNVTMAAVVVQVQDQFGNPVTQSGTTITLTLNNGGAAVLTGTNPQSTDGSGAATFNNLVVTTALGTGLNLTATGGSFSPVISSNFDISRRIIVKALNNTALNMTGSWTGGVVPGPDDIAQIDTTSVSSSNHLPDVGDNASWYGLRILGWAAGVGYTVGDATSGHVITLGAGGLVGSNLTHSLTFANNFALGADQTWIWGSGSAPGLNLLGSIDNGGYHFEFNVTQPVTVSGSINGAGDLTKSGNSTLTLNGANNYLGNTVVSNGTLLLSGTISGSSTVTVTGGTLTGNGYIYSPVIVQSGGTFAPGGGLTTLTINSNLTLQAGSLTQMGVNRDTAASDQVAGLNQVNYGGTLAVMNVSGTPQLGDTFTLFSTTSRTGTFSNISGSPGAGLAWSFNPTNGVLSVVNGTATNPTNITVVVSGNTLTLSWPEDHLGWFLQSQTNALSVGLTSNWFDVSGSDTATNAVITIYPTNPTVFFRLRSP